MNRETALTQSKEQTGFFSELWQQVQLVYKLLLDPEVPIYLKVLPFAALAYLLLPFDFLPDVVPGLGQLDDLTILIVGAKMFIDLAPQQTVERHLQRLRAKEDLAADESQEMGSGSNGGDPDIIEGIIIGEENGSSESN